MLVPGNRRPITPGAVLREDFLEPLGLTQGRAAEALGIDRTSLNELLNGRRNMTTEMALCLAHAFRTSAQYWLNLQIALDLFDGTSRGNADRLSDGFRRRRLQRAHWVAAGRIGPIVDL